MTQAETTEPAPGSLRAPLRLPASDLLPRPDEARALARDGWVVVDLLHAESVARLERTFEEIAGASTVPIYSSWWEPLEAREATDRAIRSVVLPELRTFLPGMKMVFAGFMAKQASAETAFPIHQDPTLVDETRFVPLTFWCPLIDVGTETGCMYGIPGSHRLHGQPRPAFCAFPYQAMEPRLRPLLKPIPMRAGQVLLFHPGLFHASTPNLGGRRRIAAAGSLVPEEAQVRYYRRRDTAPVVDVHEVGPGFYVRVRPEDGTDHLRKIAAIADETPPLDVETLTALAARAL